MTTFLTSLYIRLMRKFVLPFATSSSFFLLILSIYLSITTIDYALPNLVSFIIKITKNIF